MTANTIINAALTFASFAAFAAPPPLGFLLGGIFATMNVLLSAGTGSGNTNAVDVVKQIGDIVLADIEDSSILGAVSDFNAYGLQFSEYCTNTSSNSPLAKQIPLPINLNAELKANPYGDFATAYELLRNAISKPGDKLISGIEMMRISDNRTTGVNMQVKALPAFLQGVSIYVAYYKAFLLINVHCGVGFTDFELGDLTSKIDSYSKHVADMKSYIEKQISDRMNQIGEVLSGTMPGSSWGLSGATTIHYLYFTDSGQAIAGVSLPDGNDRSLVSDAPAGTVYAVYSGQGSEEQIKNALKEYKKMLCSSCILSMRTTTRPISIRSLSNGRRCAPRSRILLGRAILPIKPSLVRGACSHSARRGLEGAQSPLRVY